VAAESFKEHIRENKLSQITSSMQSGKKYGHQLLEEHMNQLILQKLIKPEDAIAKANMPEMIQTGAPSPQPVGAR